MLWTWIGKFKDLMGVKSKQGQHEKNHRQVLFTMAKIMFEMVPLILQGIKGLILNLPPDTAASDQIFDIIFAN
ncbi:MAG: hypothetical protein GY860_03200 [Desulfobacteraceae bacterium]|nr:hypothetical protein [Desulfobacteraceae bacterium]